MSTAQRWRPQPRAAADTRRSVQGAARRACHSNGDGDGEGGWGGAGGRMTSRDSCARARQRRNSRLAQAEANDLGDLDGGSGKRGSTARTATRAMLRAPWARMRRSTGMHLHGSANAPP